MDAAWSADWIVGDGTHQPHRDHREWLPSHDSVEVVLRKAA